MDRLSSWLFGPRRFEVLIIGAEGTGKTTFLSQLRHGKSCPTNYTTVEHPYGYQWRFWEVGEDEKRKPMLQRFLRNHIPGTAFVRAKLVIFLHDCEDAQKEPSELLNTFMRDMAHSGSKHIWIVLNKQDSSNIPADPRELHHMYDQWMYDNHRSWLRWKVVDHKVSAKTGEGVWEGLDDLHAAMAGKGARSPWNESQLPPRESLVPPDNVLSHAEIRTHVQKEITEDMLDPEEFWSSLLSADVSTWNHYSYLKAGYLAVLESAKNGEGTFEMVETFLAHMKRLREKAQDKFRDTDHWTMTAFWLLQIQTAIQQYRIDFKEQDLPSKNDFQQVLLHTPSLMNSHLWTLYYSPQCMFSPRDMGSPRQLYPHSESEWTPPNFRPLPMQAPILRDPATCLTIKDSPGRLRRYGWVVINIVLNSTSPPTDIIKHALESLQRTTTRLRLRHPSVPPYSETQARFWIDIAHAAMRSRFRYPGGSQNKKSIKNSSVPYFDYSSFTSHPELELISWKKYYTTERWNSVAARIEFLQPDIKSLPHIIPYPWLDVDGIILGDSKPGLPPIEELSFLASLIMQEAKALLSSGTVESPIIASHSHLLIYLYTKLFTECSEEDEKHPENASYQRAQRVRDLLSEMSGPYLDSITQRGFWIHHMMTAVLPEEIGKKHAHETPTFGELLLNNLYLVHEDLPTIYYNPHRWISEEGKEAVLEPDRLRIPGFLGGGKWKDLGGWVVV